MNTQQVLQDYERNDQFARALQRLRVIRCRALATDKAGSDFDRRAPGAKALYLRGVTLFRAEVNLNGLCTRRAEGQPD